MKNIVLQIVVLLGAFFTGGNLYAQKVNQVIMVGGGSSHDYHRWYQQEDRDFLNQQSHLNVRYTENTDSLADYLKNADLLILVNNQEIAARSKNAIEKHVAKGKPVLMLHAATWYNWKDWPQYNLDYLSGGSNSHEKFQEFKHLVVNKAHPITQGVSPQFYFKDELYIYQPELKGRGIEVLLIGESLETGKVFPTVFTVKHPKAKLVGITLGHDEHSHLNEDYKTLLINSVNWALNL